MNEVEPGKPAATPSPALGPALAPERVGARLRQGREALGLSLAEVGQRTRVPLRHLEAIEATDFAALPSPTYAVGFARAYARAVGLDEVEIAREVRAEVAKIQRPPEYEPYETADPARVPSRGVAIVGLGLAVAILVLVGLWYGTDLFRGAPPVTTAALPATAPTAAAPVGTPTPAPAPRQVALTAGADEVWMRVYDANDQTLYLGTLQPGQTFNVPPAAIRPMINVGRPDQLQVTVDGRAVPPLGDGSRAIRDVPVDAAAMAARLDGAPAPGPSGVASATPGPVVAAPVVAGPPAETPAPTAIRTPAPTASPTRTPTRTAAQTRSPAARRASASPTRPRPRPKRRVLTETQRANLESAANPPPPGPPRR